MKELKKIIYAMLLSVAFITISVGVFIVTCKLTGHTATFVDATFGLSVSTILLLCYCIADDYAED